MPNQPTQGQTRTGSDINLADEGRRRAGSSPGDTKQQQRDQQGQSAGNMKPPTPAPGRQPNEDLQDDADENDDSSTSSKPGLSGAKTSPRGPQEEIIGTGGAGGKPGRTGDPGRKE